MSEDSKSNREKVYTAQGSVFFAKAYNCSPPASDTPHTLTVFLSVFTAKDTIWKSPESHFNKNKICSKGRALYVVGDVCGPGSREYLVFSPESWVFKRMWGKIGKYVEGGGGGGVCVEEMEVICEGYVKNKWNVKENEEDDKRDEGDEVEGFVSGDNNSSITNNQRGRQRRTDKRTCDKEDEEVESGYGRRKGVKGRGRRKGKDKMVKAMKVQFTNDPMSCVWFTESGIAHMEALASSFRAKQQQRQQQQTQTQSTVIDVFQHQQPQSELQTQQQE